MKEFTLGRTPIYGSTVVKLLVHMMLFNDMKDLTLGSNPVYVSNVGKLSITRVTFQHIKVHTGEKPYVYKQCQKTQQNHYQSQEGADTEEKACVVNIVEILLSHRSCQRHGRTCPI